MFYAALYCIFLSRCLIFGLDVYIDSQTKGSQLLNSSGWPYPTYNDFDVFLWGSSYNNSGIYYYHLIFKPSPLPYNSSTLFTPQGTWLFSSQDPSQKISLSLKKKCYFSVETMNNSLLAFRNFSFEITDFSSFSLGHSSTLTFSYCEFNIFSNEIQQISLFSLSESRILFVKTKIFVNINNSLLFSIKNNAKIFIFESVFTGFLENSSLFYSQSPSIFLWFSKISFQSLNLSNNGALFRLSSTFSIFFMRNCLFSDVLATYDSVNYIYFDDFSSRIYLKSLFLLSNSNFSLEISSYSSVLLSQIQIASSSNSQTPLLTIKNPLNLYISSLFAVNSQLTTVLSLNNISNLSLNASTFSNLSNSTSLLLSSVSHSLLQNLLILHCSSYIGTPGLLITDSTILLRISHAFFIGNLAYYHPKGDIVGCAIAFLAEDSCALIVYNSSFKANSLITSLENSNRYGGACLTMSIGSTSSLYILSSHFLSNTAKFLSNAIFFSGHLISLMNSTFTNNTPFFDSLDYSRFLDNPTVFSEPIEVKTLTFGGAVYIETLYNYIENCRFSQNAAFEGGSIYYSDVTKGLITHCQFTNNSASWGGVLFFSKFVDGARFSIENSYFNDNYGREGGAIMVLFVNSFLLVSSSVFTGNQAQQCGVFAGIHVNSAVLFKGNVFLNNMCPQIGNKISTYTAGVFGVMGSQTAWILFNKNKILKSFSYIAAGAGGLLLGHYIGNNELFYSNQAGTKGGTLVAEEFGEMLLMNSLIVDTSSLWRGGAIEVTANSWMVMRNVNITGARSALGGVVSLSIDSNLTVENCGFFNGSANRGGLLIGLETGVAMFINCLVVGFDGETSIIDVTDFNVSFSGCSVWNVNTGVMTLEGSVGRVENTSIQNVTIDSEDYPAFDLIEGSLLNLKNNIVKNIGVNGFQLILIISAEYSDILIDSLVVKNAWAQQESATQKVLMKMTVSNVTMINSLFISDLDVFSGENLIHLTISNVTFKGNQNSAESLENSNDNNDGFVSLIDCNSVLIEDSKFLNGLANTGGGFKLYFLWKNSTKETLLKNCLFLNNIAEFGGGISSYNSRIRVFNGIFTENYATDSGGAVYIVFSEERIERDMTFIENCSFLNNSAKSGGAIRWIKQQPFLFYCQENTTLSNCSTFTDNQAQYGPVIASSAIRLYCEMFNKTSHLKLFDSRKSSNLSFFLAASGQTMEISLIFTFIDIYNQTVVTLLPSLENIALYTQSDLMTKLNASLKRALEAKAKRGLGSGSMKPFITGQTAPLSFGSINFSSLRIFCQPNTQVFLVFGSPQINFISIFLGKSFSALEISISNTYHFILPLYIRKCITGEVLISQVQTCMLCPRGYFSFNVSDEECSKCPNNVDCPGGRTIIVNPGYWRSSENSSLIFSCLTESNCLGGDVCDDMFEGPLCESCHSGFSRTGSSSCSDCLSEFLSVLRIIMAIVMLVGVLVMLIRSSLENMKIINRLLKDKNWLDEKQIWNFMDFQNIYMKILINNMQIMTVLNDINVDWPDFMLNFLDFLQYFTSLSSKLMAFECIYEEKTSYFATIYLKVLVTNLLPFIMVVFITIYWYLSKCILKSKEPVLQKIYTTIIGLFVMLQPSILSQDVTILNCLKLDPGISVIRANPKTSCNTRDHEHFSNYLAIPSFFFWAILWPLTVGIYLTVKKKKLYSAAVFGKLSFFYIGYREKYFYWDMVIMFRKMLLIVVMTFSGFDILSKLYIILFIYGAGFLAQIILQPFATQGFNKLEGFSFTTGIIGVFLAFMIVLTNDNSLKVFIYIIILLLNISFLVFWGIYYIRYSVKVYAKAFRNRFPRQYELLAVFLKKTNSIISRINRASPIEEESPKNIKETNSFKEESEKGRLIELHECLKNDSALTLKEIIKEGVGVGSSKGIMRKSGVKSFDGKKVLFELK